LRRGAARVAGVVRRRRRAHDLAVLAVEGVRLRRLADRLHGVSGGARRRDRESAGHGARLPAGALADRCGRRDGGRPDVLPAASGAARRDPRHRRARAWRARAAVHRAACRRRVLLLHPRERGRRSDADRRAADPRVPRRRDSGHRVRRDRRLLLPRGVRRTAEGHGRRRGRTARGRPARARRMTIGGRRRAAAAATFVVAGLAALAAVDPLRAGLTARYFPNASFDPPVVRTTRDAWLSTDGLVAAWRGRPPDGFSATWSGSLVAVR